MPCEKYNRVCLSRITTTRSPCLTRTSRPTSKDLPGENKIGFNPEPPSENALVETCMTINNSWGYNAGDTNHKSATQLIRILSECASRDANLLLNVGPKSDGTIQPEHQERLREMGTWLRENGRSVYRTRGKVFSSTLGRRNPRRASALLTPLEPACEPSVSDRTTSSAKVSKTIARWNAPYLPAAGKSAHCRITSSVA